MYETNYRPSTSQSKAYTGTSAAVDNAFGANIHVIRVVVTTDAFVAVGTSPTATTSDMFLVAFAPEYFTVTEGQKIAAVRSSVSGTMYVTEMSTS